MKLKDLLVFMFVLFCVITTAQLTFRVVHTIVFLEKEAPFASIPVIALASTFPMLVFLNSNQDSQKKFLFRLLLHFVLTTSIVLALLLHYNYIGWTIHSLHIAVLFMVIYMCGFFGYFYHQKRIIKRLNERLNEFRKDKD